MGSAMDRVFGSYCLDAEWVLSEEEEQCMQHLASATEEAVYKGTFLDSVPASFWPSPERGCGSFAINCHVDAPMEVL